jgi:hypothetical protein
VCVIADVVGVDGGEDDFWLYIYVMCASHSINTCAASIRGWWRRRESHIALLSTSFAPSLAVLPCGRDAPLFENLKKKIIFLW